MEAKRSENTQFFFSLRSETKNLKRNEAKTSEKNGLLFSLEHAKTKRNESRFASFRFEAKKIFKRNRRTLCAGLALYSGPTLQKTLHGKTDIFKI
jgi:hypothetical protein